MEKKDERRVRNVRDMGKPGKRRRKQSPGKGVKDGRGGKGWGAVADSRQT